MKKVFFLSLIISCAFFEHASAQITFFYHPDSPDSIWTWNIRGGRYCYFPDSAHAERTVHITNDAAYWVSHDLYIGGFRTDSMIILFCPVTIGTDSGAIKLIPDTAHQHVNAVIRRIMCEPGAFVEVFNYTNEDYDSLVARGFDGALPAIVFSDPLYYDEEHHVMRQKEFTVIRSATYECVLFQDELMYEGRR